MAMMEMMELAMGISASSVSGGKRVLSFFFLIIFAFLTVRGVNGVNTADERDFR